MNTYDIYLVKSGLVGIYGEWQWLNLRAFDDYSEACKFAKMVEIGAHLQPIIDLPDANWVPAARPDIRKVNQPLVTY